MTTIATIGYEGAMIADFLATLEEAEISIILDVRELPLSRRHGFSKGQLEAALAGRGIGYIHLRGLGDPKEGRDAARAGEFEKFQTIYLRHLKTAVAQAQLAEAEQLIKAGGACLLCYERAPEQCHRRLVADALSRRMPIRIRHLGVRERASRDRREGAGRGTGTRQSVAACR